MSDASPSPLHLVVNGESRTCEAPLSVADLLAQLDLAVPRVAVLINGDLVTREAHAATALRDGDAVDVISMVGGG